MTREEAINMLKAKRDCIKRETSGVDEMCNNGRCMDCPLNYEQGNMGEQKEALDMAIKALEQEPCDCISREEVCDYIAEFVNHEYATDRERELVKNIIGGIQHLPSIQPKLKTGRWIGHREHCENLGVMPSGLGAYEWCSNCDCGIDLREWHRNNYNFCPNCGAKMLPTDSEKE